MLTMAFLKTIYLLNNILSISLAVVYNKILDYI